MSEEKNDAAALAKTLRNIIGDGNVGYVTQPIQAGFLRDVADALDENERLQQESQSIGIATYELGRNSLVDENTKLRKLASDMWVYITEPVGKRRDVDERLARFDDIADRMQQLGIEADK